ncbi:tetratricopeptide repeat protein [Streptomyces sp. NPDC006516]|uniref:ATP-binding protein n=1 Tax=Streptomyces sp. NPDC006516 TaxID=3154309 RepID=UPI0033ACB5A8
MNSEREVFGALLRQLRLDAHLTIQGLADLSGVSARGIGDLERGRRAAPRRRTVAALAAGLGLDTEQCGRLLTVARRGRGPASSAMPVHSFPRRTDDFVGRLPELVSLTALAAEEVSPAGGGGSARDGSQPVVVTVAGPPGMGKTALALHAATKLVPHFPDGQMVLDLRGMDETPASATELMLSVLKAFRVADGELVKAGPTGHAALYQDLLAERRCLLIFDNGCDEEQVEPLLPERGRSMVVVTSRRVLIGLRNVHRICLSELAQHEAVAFLTTAIGEERATREASALREVAHLCGYLPLALRVAGSWLATRTGWTVRRLADRLASDEHRLDSPVAGGRKVSAAFDLSYRQLTPDAARLFRRLSVVPGPDAGVACAAQLLGQDLPSAEDTLEELVEAGLLGPRGDRFRLHDLLRLYASGRLEAEEGHEEAERVRGGLYRWLLETTIVAGRWFEPGHGAPPAHWRGLVDLSSAALARQWLQIQGANWLAALRAAAQAGEHPLVVEVAESLHWFSDQWVFWGHWPEVYDMAARSAGLLGDEVMRATHLNYYAWALIVCESRPEAGLPVASQALAAALREGDVPQQAWAHYYQGWAHRSMERFAEAAEQYGRATPLFASTGDHHGSLWARHGCCSNLLSQGEGAAALAAYQQTLTMLEDAGDLIETHIAAAARISIESGIGRSYALLEKWDDAVTHIRRAVRLSDALGNLSLRSIHLLHLGEVLLSQGREEEAHEAFRACVALGSDADPVRLAEASARLARLNTKAVRHRYERGD